MSDTRTMLRGAADHLTYLYEGARHAPADLVAHAQDIKGRVTPRGSTDPVAQFFWGGLAEPFIALGPASLPLLATLLRSAAAEIPGGAHDTCFPADCSTAAALALAEHILKTKENT